MALPLLPLLGGLIRGAVLSAPRAAMALGRAGRAAGAAGRAFAGRGLPARQTFNLAALARQLGTPNPSPAQIAAARQQIAQHNAQTGMRGRLTLAGQNLGTAGRNLGMAGLEMGKFVGAIGTATKGLTFLGRIANDAATNQLRMYNPALAALAGEKSRAEMRYNIARGRLVQGTTRSLGQSLITHQQEWQPYMALMENLSNKIAQGAVQLSIGFEALLEKAGITQMVRGLNRWLGGEEGRPSAPMTRFIDDSLAGKWLRPLSGRPDERREDRM